MRARLFPNRRDPTINSVNIDHLFAFGAATFIPDMAYGFICELARRTFLEDLYLPKQLPNLLLSAHALRYHSDIFHLYAVDSHDRSKYMASRYYFQSEIDRPYGKPFPVICDACQVLTHWSHKNRRPGKSGIVYPCANSNCSENFVAKRPKGNPVRLTREAEGAAHWGWWSLEWKG